MVSVLHIKLRLADLRPLLCKRLLLQMSLSVVICHHLVRPHFLLKTIVLVEVNCCSLTIEIVLIFIARNVVLVHGLMVNWLVALGCELAI